MTEKPFEIEDLPKIWDITARQDWLVKNLIPSKSVILLTGESGSGKSSVALSLARSVATGEPFLGFECSQRKVLLVDKENGLPIYHERLARFDIKESDNLYFWGHWCEPEPLGPQSAAIARFVQANSPLVIFDSFISFHPGSEQDATETREYMDWYRKLASLGGTIMIVHHTGKGDHTKEYRGSSDIKASVDVGYVLTAKKPLLKLLSLKPFKSREGVLDPILMTLEASRLVPLDPNFIASDDNDWKQVLRVIQQSPGLSQLQIIKALPEIPVYRVRKILMAGESKGDFQVMVGAHNTYAYFPGAGKHARGNQL